MNVPCEDTLANYNNIMRTITYHQNQIPILQSDAFQMLPEVNRCKRLRLCPAGGALERPAGGARHKRITKRVKSNYRSRIKSKRKHSRRKQRR